MKLLYENTKSCSSDVGNKIDELKKIIQMQQNSLTGGQPAGPNPFLSGQMNPAQMEGFLDPTIIKKGMDDIKEQMRDVQREAHVIESEMESRFKDMMLKNEAKKRNVPASLTSELEEHQNRAQELTDEISKVPSYNQTRDLIMQRLGGPFDYSQFTEDIRKLKVERE